LRKRVYLIPIMLVYVTAWASRGIGSLDFHQVEISKEMKVVLREEVKKEWPGATYDEIDHEISKLHGETIDLNGDGVAEILIPGTWCHFCGNKGCPAWALQKFGENYRVILSRVSDWIHVSKTSTNGYADLVDGGVVYKFDGQHYTATVQKNESGKSK